MNHLRKRFSPLLSTNILQYSITSAERLPPQEFMAVMKYVDDIFTYNRLIRMRKLSILQTKKTNGNVYSLLLAIRTGNCCMIRQVMKSDIEFIRADQVTDLLRAVYESQNTGIITMIGRVLNKKMDLTASPKNPLSIYTQETILRTEQYEYLQTKYRTPPEARYNVTRLDGSAIESICNIAEMDGYLPSLELIARAVNIEMEMLVTDIIKHVMNVYKHKSYTRRIWIDKYHILDYLSDSTLYKRFYESVKDDIDKVKGEEVVNPISKHINRVIAQRIIKYRKVIGLVDQPNKCNIM